MAEGLEAILTPRSVEDVFAERVRVQLGGTEFVLPVLTIAAEEEWKRALDARFDRVLAEAGTSPELGRIFGILEQYPDQLLDALISYDRTGVLPAREEIRQKATGIQLLRAVLEVRQSANPLVVIGLAIGIAMTTSAPSKSGSGGPSNGRRPAGRGRRRATSGRT